MSSRHSQTSLLRIGNDPKRGAVLHATAWVLELALRDNVTARLLRKFLQANLQPHNE